MAIDSTRITIVGCGPGSPDYVTEAARRAVRDAQVLVGSRRLLAMFADGPAERIVADADVPAVLEHLGAAASAGHRVAVLVSGDPGLYSLAQQVVRRFGRQQCTVIAGISSVQLAFARLGLDWADARVISAHGRTPAVAIEELAALDKIAVLAGSRDATGWAARAAEALRATHVAFLCENLTLDGESVRQVEPEQLGHADASSLSIVLLIRSTCLA